MATKWRNTCSTRRIWPVVLAIPKSYREIRTRSLITSSNSTNPMMWTLGTKPIKVQMILGFKPTFIRASMPKMQKELCSKSLASTLSKDSSMKIQNSKKLSILKTNSNYLACKNKNNKTLNQFLFKVQTKSSSSNKYFVKRMIKRAMAKEQRKIIPNL